MHIAMLAGEYPPLWGGLGSATFHLCKFLSEMGHEITIITRKLKGEDRKILKLRPGITGTASLKYANEEEILAAQDDPQKYNDEVIFPDKVKVNLEYYENQTLWLDIKIIFATIFRTSY